MGKQVSLIKLNDRLTDIEKLLSWRNLALSASDKPTLLDEVYVDYFKKQKPAETNISKKVVDMKRSMRKAQNSFKQMMLIQKNLIKNYKLIVS